MYMATLRHESERFTIHLYKHRDTRRYINLDDGGSAYEYLAGSGDPSSRSSAGCYRRHRYLIDAIDRLELHLFECDPPFYRSFPPEEWPPERSDPQPE
jgi:hypothetical protein